jgi:hypothetical protein
MILSPYTDSVKVTEDVGKFLQELACRKATFTKFIADKVSIGTDFEAYKLHQYFFVISYQEVPNRLTLRGEYKLQSLLDYLFDNYLLFHRSIHTERADIIFADKKDTHIISVYIDHSNITSDSVNSVIIHSRHKCNVESIVKNLSIYRNNNKKKSTIGIFVKEFGEVVVKDYNIDSSKYKFDSSLYNQDFEEASMSIIEKLNQNESGLYLLHGAPGTGKSSYIRHLTSTVDRRFVYVPPNMVDVVFSVDLLSMFIGELKNSILIVEDAEKVLLQRDASDGYHNSSTISTLLNTTDGIYSDLTKLSIICTYNCDRNSIDKAFLRKGRLRFEYMFRPLDVERAKALASQRNIQKEITAPITLAELLNDQDVSIEGNTLETEKRVGFF